MIVGTAGHIDHGKTALIQALTGVDADRLAEEKARGITIDLGFAYTDLGDGSVTGFVDVPGHERLIHTMVAGAGGVDPRLRRTDRQHLVAERARQARTPRTAFDHRGAV